MCTPQAMTATAIKHVVHGRNVPKAIYGCAPDSHRLLPTKGGLPARAWPVVLKNGQRTSAALLLRAGSGFHWREMLRCKAMTAVSASTVPPSGPGQYEVSAFSLYIRHEVVNIKYSQLEGSNYKTGCIDALTIGEEFLGKFILTFLQAFDTKGHATQSCYLVFGIA